MFSEASYLKSVLSISVSPIEFLYKKLPVTEPYVKDRLNHEHLIQGQDVLRKSGQDPEKIFGTAA